MRRLTKKFMMTFHDMRMLACPSDHTVNTKSLTKFLSVVKGEAALLVDDKRVRRTPSLDPNLVKHGTQLFLGPICQSAN